jgi:hypothetical protein
MERPSWVPADVDLTRPSAARVYDYYLGGSHNLEVDRRMAREAIAMWPDLPAIMQSNRAFLRRAVRYVAEQGISQFLDIGSGIPTVGNVHEAAQQVNPDARVVYVDSDPIAVAHSRAILAGNEQTAVVQADLREPDALFEHPAVGDTIDLNRPVAVLMVAVLHFVSDEDDPWGMIAGYRDRLAPGSFLAISHAGYEADEETDASREARKIYNRDVTRTTIRDRTEFGRLFDGFALVEPGVVRVPAWHPESPADIGEFGQRFPGFAAIGRKEQR